MSPQTKLRIVKGIFTVISIFAAIPVTLTVYILIMWGGAGMDELMKAFSPMAALSLIALLPMATLWGLTYSRKKYIWLLAVVQGVVLTSAGAWGLVNNANLVGALIELFAGILIMWCLFDRSVKGLFD